MNEFRLEIGDWSNDGHGQCVTYTIQSNKTKQEIDKAYKKAVKNIGFDVLDLCKEYEESTIPADTWKRLKSEGFDPNIEIAGYSLGNAEPEENEDMYMDVDGFMLLVLWFLKTGDPDLILKPIPEIKERLVGTYEHIGYGLFQ